MSTVRRLGQVLSGAAGRFFRERSEVAPGGIGITGIDVLGESRPGAFPPSRETPSFGSPSNEPFDIGAILRLRTFLYLIAVTAVFLFQIHNTLTIKDLAKENERLREQLRISTSIRTAQELKANELRSIHNISGYAQSMGLSSSAVPPVDIEP
jgi:hypothetical protein